MVRKVVISKGFTLVELLLVMVIMGILAAMLLPAISEARQSVQSYMTRQRITLIDGFIQSYQRVYSEYPPSMCPYSPTWTYPRALQSDGSQMEDIFNGDYQNRPLGGQLLVYFLLGPENQGWNIVKHKVTHNWEAPQPLAVFRTPEPVNFGRRYYYLRDSFGSQGNASGYIMYAKATPRTRNTAATSRFCDTGAFDAVYALSGAYGPTVKTNYDLGDGKVSLHIRRMTDQCTKDYLLLSAGMNNKFGYYYYTGEYWKADCQRGVTDDIANFPLTR